MTKGPLKTVRIFSINVRWDKGPEWPPPPNPIAMRPSTPWPIAFFANSRLMTSCSTPMPFECATRTTSRGPPFTLMTVSTP
ncbi:hypothetical protein D3C71_1844210 [compost metagenome]